jgi:hypothetical protein
MNWYVDVEQYKEAFKELIYSMVVLVVGSLHVHKKLVVLVAY